MRRFLQQWTCVKPTAATLQIFSVSALLFYTHAFSSSHDSHVPEIVTASNTLCAQVGRPASNISVFSTTCPSASTTGSGYYPVPSAPALVNQRIQPVSGFNATHNVLDFGNLNNVSESVFVATCMSACDAYANCTGFFVNYGIPSPPVPAPQSNAPRWFCGGYNVALTPDDFQLATVNGTYIFLRLSARRVSMGQVPYPRIRHRQLGRRCHSRRLRPSQSGWLRSY